MALQAALDVLCRRLQQVIGQIEDIDRTSGDVPQSARTRMQRGLPLTLHARLEAWTAPLRRHVDRLREFSPRVLVLQVGGPIGTDDGPWVAELAHLLKLPVPSRCPHCHQWLDKKLHH